MKPRDIANPIVRVRAGGFTIVELMIVVAIAAILAMIAIPSFRDMLNTTRQNSAYGLLVNDLNQARGEAIKLNNKHVIVCARDTDGTQCVATADWRAGWLVCVESNVANQCVTAATAEIPNPVLILRSPLDAALTLTASATDPIRFVGTSARGAGSTSLVLKGTWAGATLRYVCIAGTGNISKQMVVCP